MAYVSGRLRAGQVTGLGVTAQPVSTVTINIRECIIQSDPANTTNLLVGDAAAQHVALTPGQSITIPIVSLSLVYVKMASSTGTVNWLVRD